MKVSIAAGWCLSFLGFWGLCVAAAEEAPIPESWDYAPAMKRVAAGFRGRPGVVIHVGDSITYANPYGQWARHGAGKTPEDAAVLKWMHCGAEDSTDGWWLCRFDHPAGGRSHTACGGIRADEMLAGGRQGLPSLADMLKKYQPQIVVLMLGTNDASAGRPVNAYLADMEKSVDLILSHCAICVLSTIPPHPHRTALAASYNEALRELARSRSIPLIDYEQEILRRRPNDWNGTLLNRNDVHPTATVGKVNAASAPTPENLRTSGYLLRGWLSVRKIAEVKRKVLDALPADKPEKHHQGEKPEDSRQSARQAWQGSDQTVAGANNQESVGTGTARSDSAVRLPPGKLIRLGVTRDTWFSAVGKEADCNLGGAAQLKLKSIQEMSLVDLDPAPLRGYAIAAAVLHVRQRGHERLHRVTVSSFASPWVEGTSPSYTPQVGSSTFNHRCHPTIPWAYPGSDLTAVTLGQGGTIWRMADAIGPDDQLWQQIPVDPEIVAARVAGISHGFLLFDDTGSQWTRDGEQFQLRLFPNRFVHSRESGPANAPYFTIVLGPEDHQSPAAPAGLTSSTDDLPAGEALVSWLTPQDQGPAGTVGFLVQVDQTPLPSWMIPRAGSAGQRVSMRLRDLGLAPGAKVSVSVRAVDGAGNVGPAATATVKLSARTILSLPGTNPEPFRQAGPLPRVGETTVCILDALDKVHPITGEMIPPQSPNYLAANHLWSARERRIRLAGARNEFVAFQIHLIGASGGVQPVLQWDRSESAAIRVEFSRYAHVSSKRGPLPDPVVPLDMPKADENLPGQKRASMLAEIYIPHGCSPGAHPGRLMLRSQHDTLQIDLLLWVWDFALPDVLTFLPEMNCYGLPANERAYYRLAHRHRTVLNRVPYYQNGTVHEGCAPAWDGKRLDWSRWDERFGSYFDGSAMADLPRRGVPLECFYLPVHENWPSPMEGNYNGSYWADQAFPPGYRQTLVEVARQMAEHFENRGWHRTLFLAFWNNKNNFKQRGWSRGSSPWLLDEPANFQDYWALRWFGEAFHEGVGKALAGRGNARLCFRCDISRPQWQRDALDHVLDYNVVAGGAFRQYRRLVLDRKQALGQIVLDYGSTNAIEQSNTQPVAWCIDSWTLGSDGVVPWQTVGTERSWQEADRLALFYPGQTGPVPSIRLKAYCRGQQDVEYLALAAEALGQPRWAMGQSVRRELQLAATGRTKAGADDDAGTVAFDSILPQDLWALRVRIGRVLSALPGRHRPTQPDQLRTPPRHPCNPAQAMCRFRAW